MHALVAGSATSEQQKVALRWILHKACGVSFDTFVEGFPDTTLIHQGRRQAGLMISNVLTTPPENYRKKGEQDQ